uniref:NADH-ubiquinone oxidoreductase chain 1 n=1 Tax=Spathoderma clenchi TaxID=1638910 RepID=A0A343YNC7_9MOLL|nr:NADH dehydrogenase subunit 1 [Spathoderma clenchi]
MLIISYLITAVCLMLSVAMFTMFERKGLSYSQARKGPNKVSLMGLPQPLADAAKLFTKKPELAMNTNYLYYLIAPAAGLMVVLLLWVMYPMLHVFTHFKLMMLLALSLISLNVYSLLIAGWASNSKYALLGALRAMAQIISYEIAFVLLFLTILVPTGSYDLKETTSVIAPCLFLGWLSAMWLITCIAEVNRAPLDFAEGESELVSGFNIEYSGASFAFIFLAEYTSILTMSMLSAFLLANNPGPEMMMTIKLLLLAFAFVWARSTFPRMRYDHLMSMCWHMILPISLISAMTTVFSVKLILL